MQEIFHVHTYRCKHASDEKDSDFRKTREHLGCFSAMIEGVDSHSTEEMRDRVEVAKMQTPILIMSSTKNPQALSFQQRTNLVDVKTQVVRLH